MSFPPKNCALPACSIEFVPKVVQQMYCCKNHKDIHFRELHPTIRTDKVCAYDKCKKTFTPKRGYQKFCKEECRTLASGIPKNCKFCNKPFFASREVVEYCSISCSRRSPASQQALSDLKSKKREQNKSVIGSPAIDSNRVLFALYGKNKETTDNNGEPLKLFKPVDKGICAETLIEFCKAIESAGGVCRDGDKVVPVMDLEWESLGKVYLKACEVCQFPPLIARSPRNLGDCVHCGTRTSHKVLLKCNHHEWVCEECERPSQNDVCYKCESKMQLRVS